MHKLALIVLSPVLASAASAQYLIDTAGGTVLSTVGHDDNVHVGRPMGFTARFFGVEHTLIDVSTNGFLNFGAVGNANGVPFPLALEVVAPLWDDLVVEQGDSIIENVQPGVSYAVTWELSDYYHREVKHGFQAVWFGAPTTIDGLAFNAGDIVFSYKTVGAAETGWTASVGLCKDNTTYVPLLHGTDAQVPASQAQSSLPIYDATRKLIVFRAGGGSYAPFTVRTAAPAAPACPVDFNNDGFLDFFDYDDFVTAFERGC